MLIVFNQSRLYPSSRLFPFTLSNLVHCPLDCPQFHLFSIVPIGFYPDYPNGNHLIIRI